MVPMELVGVRVELPSNTPIVLLRATSGDPTPTDGLMLPIFIGGPEATAIALAHEGIEPPRPMTHDLFAQALEAMEVTVEKVVITELRERTFFAELHMRSPGEARVMSARPSDAIALAVRLDVPIFAEDELLAQVGYSDKPEAEEESEDVVEDFRDFLDSVNPDDFA
jgi:bifunctional DNase/RNase